jgi:hypothetical protein
MADPFAVEGSRLDEQFTFGNRDRVRDELRQLVQILEARLQKIETGPQKTYAEELLELQANARTAVNDALTPFFEDLSNIASLGGIFVATSLSTVIMALGPKTFTIEGEAARARFAPTTYMAARSTVDPTKIMLGEVTDYDLTTGDLTIAVSTLGGAPAVGETYASWDLLPTPPPTALPYVDGGVFGGMDATGITRTPIRFRRSNIATDAPAAANLLDGELGINYRDNRVFWRGEDALVRASKLFVGDIGDVALRSDTDQFASWTTARRNQALRNIRRALSYITANATVDPAADMNRHFLHESTADHNLTLPTLAAAGDGFRFKLRTLNLNGRGGIVTLVRQGTETIEGVNANFAIPAGQTIEVVADATIGWRIFGFSRSPLIYRIDQTAAGVASLVIPLARGYNRFLVRGQRMPKANGTNAQLQATASVDAGASYSTSYHRDYNYNSSATAWTTAVALATAVIQVGLGHGSAGPAHFTMEVAPGGNVGETPGVSGTCLTYNSSYGPTTTLFSALVNGAAPSALDTLKLIWSDGDDITGTILVTGML